MCAVRYPPRVDANIVLIFLYLSYFPARALTDYFFKFFKTVCLNMAGGNSYLFICWCRSGWLGGILPVKALEDNLCALSLAGGAELGEEVEEEPEEPDFSTIPLAFNQPRHLQVQATVSTSTGNFAGMYRQPVLRIRIRIWSDRHHLADPDPSPFQPNVKLLLLTLFSRNFQYFILSKILNPDPSFNQGIRRYRQPFP